jgi:hypothetical protein
MDDLPFTQPFPLFGYDQWSTPSRRGRAARLG